MNRSNYVLLASLFIAQVFAQTPTPITLEEAIALSLKNGKEIKKVKASTEASRLQIHSAQNMRYPELEVSGTYNRLFNGTDINLKVPLPASSEDKQMPDVQPKHLMIGQAKANIPVFSGFKITNAVTQSKQYYSLAQLNEASTTENVVYQTINLYFALYKTQQSIALLTENLKRAHQRTLDFEQFLAEGIIAKNDYLRTQLQEANVELSLEETKNTQKNITTRLKVLLDLEEGETILAEKVQPVAIFPTKADDLSSRKDVQSAQKMEEIAQTGIKIARGNFFPSIGLTAGYSAIQLDQVVDITNATSVGVGLKYDLTQLFKNRTEVNKAKAKKIEVDYQAQLVEDLAKVEIDEAFNAYELALKRNAVLAKALVQANENYRIVKDKYDNGLTDTDHLLEADVQQLQAQIDTMLGEADETLTLYQYAYKTGKLIDNLQVKN
ncbi:TolC family protein [Myroides odoratus]|uniref:Type I secretion outer membrane protein, TolC family n=1 Tax=Myroides odoratus TaxID=256 RepID=A0A378RM48_MYROD|nr:TolC family protein [Myroides odoratus]QQU05091.1 TolC family protein [Myroides odoratus]STZ27429.1 type I secretion outer membrane protein, TolC family [Myroides odoratus]